MSRCDNLDGGVTSGSSRSRTVTGCQLDADYLNERTTGSRRARALRQVFAGRVVRPERGSSICSPAFTDAARLEEQRYSSAARHELGDVRGEV